MNPTEIEFALRDLVSKPYDAESFPYDLIAIYNASKMTVSRLKSGTTNKATQPGDVLWQKQFFFRPTQPGEDVGAVGDALLTDPLTARHKPRFILVTNGEQVHIRDLKFEETANIEFERLDEESDFLLPLAGYERRALVEEHPADKNAAKNLKKLYDALLAANTTWNTGHHTHELNLLMTRLLFCFYAEDTGIFETPQIFTSTVTQQTGEDGSEVAPLLERLFRIMNIEEGKRNRETSAVDRRFPYVNGSLFEDTVDIPHFSRTARRQLLECGELDWTTITPDIFGSMIQTIAQDGTRSDLGMHYTSRPNIMKVLEPLFLDDLNEAFEKAKDSIPKLEALLVRLSKIRVFDPACGSGNFLIIAYKELRKLEMRALRRVADINPNNPLRLSGIAVHNFIGIDVVDFACETAKLSLWIAEYQMNSDFKELVGTARPPLPLGKITTLRRGNSLELDWMAVCGGDETAETYLCGNPPYLGTSMQTEEQKRDLAAVFRGVDGTNANLDYISGWLYKGAQFVAARSPNAIAGFVTTNSICQGEHIPLLWPALLSNKVELVFAHTSFKWGNQAAHNAGVSCIILGFGPLGVQRKRLFSDDVVQVVKDISPYLLPFATPIVEKRTVPLSALPIMTLGSQPSDGGNFLFTAEERKALLERHPEAVVLFRRYVGSKEFVQGIERWTLWISDDELAIAEAIPEIQHRLDRVADLRMRGGTRARPYVRVPHKYVLTAHQEGPALIMPTVTSETRKYLAVGHLDSGWVISNLAYAVYEPEPHVLSLLSSRLHLLWTVTIGGHLENRVRYSNQYVYNSFPVPALSDEQKKSLDEHARAILRARSRPGKTIAWLYNPATMPATLLAAHRENDAYIEEFIYGKRFRDDLERLEHLFAMYGRMSETKVRADTLFESQTA
jgi:hypothetical protein